MSRIRWSEEESEKIFQEVKRLRSVRPGEVMYLLVREAQKVLSPDRQRSIVNVGNVPTQLRMRIDRELYQPGASTRAFDASKAETKPPIPAEPPPPPAPAVSPLEAFFEDTAIRLLKRAVKAAFDELLEDPRFTRLFDLRGVPGMPPNAPKLQQMEPAGLKGPKILLLGVKSTEHDHFEKLFGKEFRLVFGDWEITGSSGASQKLADQSRGADVILMSTTAASHQHQHTIKGAGQWDKVTLINGNLYTKGTDYLNLLLRGYRETGKLPPRRPFFGG